MDTTHVIMLGLVWLDFFSYVIKTLRYCITDTTHVIMLGLVRLGLFSYVIKTLRYGGS